VGREESVAWRDVRFRYTEAVGRESEGESGWRGGMECREGEGEREELVCGVGG
jgi:hypothetical protein